MVLVWIAPGPPVQVEGFDESAERSCKGALHLRGRSTKELTEDELSHIEQRYPDQWRRVRVLRRAQAAATDKVKDIAKPAKKEDKDAVAKPAKSSKSKSSKSEEADDEL